MKNELLMPEFKTLEEKVIAKLKESIQESEYESEHIGDKAILVNIGRYRELAIINSELTFMDSDGYHYNLFADVTLEDLIELADGL